MSSVLFQENKPLLCTFISRSLLQPFCVASQISQPTSVLLGSLLDQGFVSNSYVWLLSSSILTWLLFSFPKESLPTWGLFIQTFCLVYTRYSLPFLFQERFSGFCSQLEQELACHPYFSVFLLMFSRVLMPSVGLSAFPWYPRCGILWRKQSAQALLDRYVWFATGLNNLVNFWIFRNWCLDPHHLYTAWTVLFCKSIMSLSFSPWVAFLPAVMWELWVCG